MNIWINFFFFGRELSGGEMYWEYYRWKTDYNSDGLEVVHLQKMDPPNDTWSPGLNCGFVFLYLCQGSSSPYASIPAEGLILGHWKWCFKGLWSQFHPLGVQQWEGASKKVTTEQLILSKSFIHSLKKKKKQRKERQKSRKEGQL